jgi:hypothetical protein
MAWLRVDDRVRTHPKIVQAGPVAAWFWFSGICYCREHLTDGFIADAILPTLAPGVTAWKKAAEALVGSGLWHREQGGYRVHDFLEWNPSRAAVMEQRARDNERKRGGFRVESGRTPDGIQTTPSRARAGDAGSPSRAVVLRSGSEKENVVDLPRYQRRPIGGKHGDCLTGCSTGMCLHEEQAMELATRLPGGFTEEGLQQVVTWAQGVVEDHKLRGVGMRDKHEWDFWKHRWAEQFGGSAPSFAQLRAKRAEDALGAAFNG